MQTTTERPKIMPPPADTFSLRSGTFAKTQSTWIGNFGMNQRDYMQGSYRASVTFRPDQLGSVVIGFEQTSNIDARQYYHAIAGSLLKHHPGIDINEDIKGIPTIKGNRISVGQVLGRVYVLGSVEAVVEFYHSTISKEQVKDAIAFAQDFLEAACEPI